MKRIAVWVWNRGIVSTFMAGLFVMLPLVITFAIMGWASGKVVELLGPESLIGRILQALGLQLLRDDTRQWLGTLLGWGIVLAAIWLIGFFVKSLARQGLQKRFHSTMERIPVIRNIYRPVSQVVSMMQKGDEDEMASMSVVYCSFGDAHGGGVLALLTSSETFRFVDRDCHVVYIPTSPLPMSGGIILVPVENVTDVDMSVEDLMQIYFSLGVMAPKVVPDVYQT